ncbi:MAG: UDP-glucose/GDP-mannose dehydrogenase family protein [Actinobacteria bacterium]|nr:UDP-glucose/GDP-mannose dehydrogenase family protein [Actinomycetota bacterium]
MKISVFGAGYVGLVTAACFAEVGHHVVCCDKDAMKIDSLRTGKVPFFEPGLSELVTSGVKGGRLEFTSDVAVATASARVAVLAVGTPSNDDGSTDLRQIHAAAREIRGHVQQPLTVLVKSTVPVGTNAMLSAIFAGKSVNVVSNPEFLREGSAVADGLKPDRIIVGARTNADRELIRELYEPFARNHEKLMFMTPESAELVKYGANSMLATRISFMNELAEYASRIGADIEDVRRGMGADPRIGSSYLYPGIGFGGSCFPKDLRSLEHQLLEHQIEPKIITSVIARNERQIELVVDAVLDAVKSQAKPVVVMWGVSFKPNTDDVREAPALKVAQRLLERGVQVRAADPIVTQAQIDAVLGKGRVSLIESEMKAAEGADVLVLVTEWRQYRSPDFEELRALMRGSTLIDGRNQWSRRQVNAAGFTYVGIGRS